MKFHKYHGLGNDFTEDLHATMTGPVSAVYDGELRNELFEVHRTSLF
jgi:diaminopimelate epimerase